MTIGAHAIVRTFAGALLRRTLTTFGIVYGDATQGIAATAAMTDGQMLVGQTNGAPLPKTLSGDATLSAAGALAIAASAITPPKVAALTRYDVIQLASGANNTVLAGAAIGDLVVAVMDFSAVGNTPTATTDINAAGKFESVISVAGHIQQTAAPSGKQSTGDYCAVILQRKT